MTDQPACPRCGTPLPVEAHGLCPTCALRTAATPAGGAPQRAMPTIQELAPAFPNYQFVEPIGRGAMGAVYLARHHKLDRQVAIKIMLAPDGTDPTFAERFAREARALARLDHPGIVGVHDFGEAAGHCFLVMDYVDGANLRQMLAQGRLSRGDVLQIVPQLCDALQYAHERGVVHRDIKPENILVDQDGRVRIADFGLAKIAGDDPLRPSLTQSGGAVGTPHYMSPEQLRGAPVDHRADLYALGVVLYEMLTGELPVGRFAPPSKKGIADARLDEVVQKALDAEPQARYQHAREVKDDLGHERPAGLPPRLPSDAAPRRLDPLDPGLLMPLVACLIATGLTYLETPIGRHNLWSTQISAGVLPRVPVAALVFLLAVECLLQWLRWYGRPVPRVWSFGLLGVVIFYLVSIAATPAQPPAEYGAGFLYLLALAVLLAGRFLKRWIEYGR